MSNKYLNYSGLSYFWQLIKSYFSNQRVGSIIYFAGTSSNIPSGWLECDGSELLIEDYSELYSVIGDTFGAASDEDYFKLPDFKGYALVGLDPEIPAHTNIGDKTGESNLILSGTLSGNPSFQLFDNYTKFTWSSSKNVASSSSSVYRVTSSKTASSGNYAAKTTVVSKNATISHSNTQPSVAVLCLIYTGVFHESEPEPEPEPESEEES